MRPRLNAGDHWRMVSGSHAGRKCFNEAPAECRGSHGWTCMFVVDKIASMRPRLNAGDHR